MTPWTEALWDIARHVTQAPAGSVEMYGLAVVGLLVMFIVFRLMASATGNGNANLFSSVLLVVGTVALMWAAAAIVRRYPFARTGWGGWAPAGAAVLALVMVAALMQLWHRVRFLAAIMTLVVALTAAALVLTGARAGYNAVMHGRSQAGKLEQHNEMLRNFGNP